MSYRLSNARKSNFATEPPGFLRSLPRSALRIEEQWADEFIALLGGVAELQLGVIRFRMRSHYGSLPAGARDMPSRSLLRTGHPKLHPARDRAPPAVRLRPSSRALVK